MIVYNLLITSKDHKSASEFWLRIQILDFFCEGGGGGGGGGGIWAQEQPDTLAWPLLQNRIVYENVPNGIQNRGHCSFNHQGKITQKV